MLQTLAAVVLLSYLDSNLLQSRRWVSRESCHGDTVWSGVKLLHDTENTELNLQTQLVLSGMRPIKETGVDQTFFFQHAPPLSDTSKKNTVFISTASCSADPPQSDAEKEVHAFVTLKVPPYQAFQTFIYSHPSFQTQYHWASSTSCRWLLRSRSEAHDLLSDFTKWESMERGKWKLLESWQNDIILLLKSNQTSNTVTAIKED